MKTTVKKIISVLLVSLMLLTTAPLSGFVGLELPEIPWTEIFIPKAHAVASGSCGEKLTWKLDDDGVLIISGTGYMTNYSEAKTVPWYSNRELVKKVIAENGVTSIGSYAFYDCGSLTDMNLPDSVIFIGDSAFQYCSSLTAIDIPDGVTNIPYCAFAGCISLNAIQLPKELTSIGDGAFQFCISLNVISIPEGVTSINRYAFYDCVVLTDVYYAGTESQWHKIEIGEENEYFTNAKIHFMHVHSYTESIEKELTCTEDGITVFTCICDDTYTETVKAEGHKMSGFVISTYPLCTKKGSEISVCSVCQHTEHRDIPAKGHNSDENGICKDCGFNANNCNHLCHRTGFLGFIWKIINFFQRIFKINPVCECGAAHY